MNCPRDGHTLEFISGTFGTGVFAPDGGQETQYQEGWQCPKCETIYDESDVSDNWTRNPARERNALAVRIWTLTDAQTATDDQKIHAHNYFSITLPPLWS
jgi:hypothetical protein